MIRVRLSSVLIASAWPFLLILLILPAVAAQNDDCPALARNTMEAVENVCQSTGRDQLCYGNINIEAAPSADAEDFVFERQGDIARVADFETLRLKTLDIASEEWGVALMRVQASLPDEAPENVSILLFGNVEVTNQGQDLTTLTVQPTTSVNVRLRPAAEGPILGTAPAYVDVIANGRITNAAGEEWIRVQMDSAPGGVGWVLGAALRSEGDRAMLTQVQSADDRPFGPMQAFTFSSGGADRPCSAAPDSGILIQTPAGVGEITFLINEVNVQIGSTTYLKAQPGGVMRASTLEGHVILSYGGVTRIVPPGTQSDIPLDENGSAAGAPTAPEPYAEDEIFPLEFSLDAGIFDEDFAIDEALDAEFLDDFNAFFNDEDSEFFDGDANDDLFAAFFERLMDDDFGERDFNTDLTENLTAFVAEDALPADLEDDFLRGVFQELDQEQTGALFDEFEESGVEMETVQDMIEVDEGSGGGADPESETDGGAAEAGTEDAGDWEGDEGDPGEGDGGEEDPGAGEDGGDDF